MTWLPQIIHNIRTRSKTSFPFVVIFLNSLNKICMPILIRVEHNFLEIRPQTFFILVLIFVITNEMCVIYIQTIYGGGAFSITLKNMIITKIKMR